MLLKQCRNLAWCMLGALVVVGQLRPANGAVIVDPGYDLLFTVNAQFNFGGIGGLGLVPFKGIPIGSFDFQPSSGNFNPQTPPNTAPNVPAGVQNIGLTDTILQRKDGVNLPDFGPLASATIDIEMIALSLQSTNPIDWSSFGGLLNEYVNATLVADTGSTMTIYNDFTFDSQLKFEIALTGVTSNATITQQLSFIQTGATWSHTPSALGSTLIDGINNNLNSNLDVHDTDFFTGLAKHGPDHIHDTIDINSVPEPSSFALFGFGLLGACFASRNRQRQSKASS